jgi:hypothetical protein
MTESDLIDRYLTQLREQETLAIDSGDTSDQRRSSLASDDSEIRATFEKLVTEWNRATKHLSSVTDMVTHPSYQRIIGMGWQAVPMLLKQLESEPDHWFWALKAITGDDPVPLEDRGNIKAMSEAWLAWGQQQGYE